MNGLPFDINVLTGRARELNTLKDLLPKFIASVDAKEKAMKAFNVAEDLFMKDCNNMNKEKVIDTFKKYLLAFQITDGMMQQVRILEKRTGVKIFEEVKEVQSEQKKVNPQQT
jgi:hypothetical protein